MSRMGLMVPNIKRVSTLTHGCGRARRWAFDIIAPMNPSLLLLLVLSAPASAAAPDPRLRYDWTAEEIGPACQAAEDRAEGRLREVAALEASSRTFANTVRELNAAYYDLLDEMGSAVFLKDVSTDARIREAATACSTRLDEFDIRTFAREDLFAAVRAYADKNDPLPERDARLVSKLLQDYRRNGLALPAETRAEIQQLQTRLVKLKTEYERNLNEVKDFLAVSSAQLAGLPQGFIDGLDKLPDGLFKVTLDYPDYIPFMRNARDAQARMRLEALFNTRGSTTNVRLLEEAIAVRHRIAQLLGYPTHAAFVLEPKMAGSPEAVQAFLDRLAGKLRPLAESDLQVLTAMKTAEEGPGDPVLRAWDFAYYDNQLKKAKYAVDDELVKEYFPLDAVMDGMLTIYQRLLGVRFEKVVPAEAWHPEVQLYRVVDAGDRRLLGHFYMDLFPREGKYKHAAAFTLVQGRERADGSFQPPVCSIVANMSKPTADAPSLLKHSEVETLFHEFGHIMHIVLLRAPHGYNRTTEFTVAQDFVEAPSQMLENWVWNKDILKGISAHYKDRSKKLPGDLLKRMIAAKNLNNGLVYSRQVFLASVDLRYHTVEPGFDSTALWSRLRSELSLIPMTPGTLPQASFGHLMGGYDAGYYGYLWSEVYAADMFSRFEREGLLSAAAGRSYRESILEPGRSKDEGAQLRAFLGREPNEDAFLRVIGFSEAKSPSSSK